MTISITFARLDQPRKRGTGVIVHAGVENFSATSHRLMIVFSGRLHFSFTSSQLTISSAM
jgi:hypothetical protein